MNLSHMDLFEFQARGLDGTIFQNPDKLHLTIGMLVLLSEAEIKAAQSLLHECQDTVVE